MLTTLRNRSISRRTSYQSWAHSTTFKSSEWWRNLPLPPTEWSVARQLWANECEKAFEVQFCVPKQVTWKIVSRMMTCGRRSWILKWTISLLSRITITKGVNSKKRSIRTLSIHSPDLIRMRFDYWYFCFYWFLYV